MTATAKTETWEQRRDRERRETADLVNAFVTKLHDVAKLLDGWDLELVQHEDEPLPSYAKFHHGTGAGFSVSLPGRWDTRNGKVEASAFWPRSADDKHHDARDWQLVSYGEASPYTIGFSTKKTAKAIAADLNRRLIPQILEGIEKVNAKLAEQKAEKASIASDVERLQVAFNTHDVREQTYHAAKLYFHEYTSVNGRVSSGGGNGLDGNLRLSNYNPNGEGNTVDLELSNLTVEQAIAVANLLSGSK